MSNTLKLIKKLHEEKWYCKKEEGMGEEETITYFDNLQRLLPNWLISY